MTQPTTRVTANPDRETRGIRRRASRCVLWGTAIAMATAAQLLATHWWVADLLTQFTVQYVLLLAPLVALLVVLGRWNWALLFVVPLVFHLWLISGYFLAAPLPPGAHHGIQIRAMTQNVLASNQRYGDLMELIRERDPDIIALQEVTEAWVDGLASLVERFPHWKFVKHEGNFGIAIYSKRPWEAIDVQWFGPRQLPSIHVLFRTEDNQKFEFVAVHSLPPTGREQAEFRNAQLLLTADRLDSGRSRIVVGDFNLTPWSPWFREFMRRGKLVDSARGSGVEPTWFAFPSWLGGVKIDHVLVSPDLIVDNHEIGPHVGSDHRAVIVDICFPDPK